MKILINESSYKKIVNEIPINPHYRNRIKKRYRSVDYYDVILEKGHNHNSQRKIGIYKIPSPIREKIDNIYKFLEKDAEINNDYKNIVVILHTFIITPDDIIFDGNTDKEREEIRRSIDFGDKLLLSDPIDPNDPGYGPTGGNVLICLIKEGELMTTIFAKNDSDFYLTKKFLTDTRTGKISIPQIIHDPIRELSKYEPPKEVINHDKENRRLAYLNKMKKNNPRK